ncbi:hypothetical protein BCR42DRAFT_410715, partial [Absidia repens]
MPDLLNRFWKKGVKPYDPPPRITTVFCYCRRSTCTKQHSIPFIKTQTDKNIHSQQRLCHLYHSSINSNNPKISTTITTHLLSEDDEVDELFDQEMKQRKIGDTQLPTTMKPLPLPPFDAPPHEHRNDLRQTPSSTKYSHRSGNTLLNPSIYLSNILQRGSSIFSALHQKRDNHDLPEYFIQKFMGANLRTVSVSDASSLESSLRTRPLIWLEKFIDLKGMHILMLCLRRINHQKDRTRKKPLDIEFEVIKCIKIIINTRIGGIEITNHPNYIHTIVFSLLCPRWQTRKLVCDSLVSICYNKAGNGEQDTNLGHQHIIRGFELLQQTTNDKTLFDTWMKQLEHPWDGYDRMGPFVATRNDLKKHGVLKLPSKQLMMEYVTSNMLLINALTNVPKTESQRMVIRYQLNTSGMEARVLPKFRCVEYLPLKSQVTAYEKAAANDLKTILNDESRLYYGNNDTEKLLEPLVNGMELSSKSADDLLDNMKSLMVTKGSLETKEYYSLVIHALMHQLAAGRWAITKDQDVTALFGVPAKDIIQHYRNLDRLRQLKSRTIHNETRKSQVINDNETMDNPVDTEAKHVQVVADSNRGLKVQLEERKINSTPDRSHSRENISTVAKEKSSIASQSLLVPPPPPPPPPPSSILEMDSSHTVASDTLSPPPPPPRLSPIASHEHSRQYITPTTPIKKMQHQSMIKLKNLHIDTMFPAKSNTTFDRKLKAITDEKMDVVKFLSGNKSRGLNIAVLPKLKHFGNYALARQTIMHMDPDFCTENMLNNLIMYAPSREDDLITMDKYTKATAKQCLSLDLPEQFTIEMTKIYRYPQRLHFMLFRVQFWEKLDRLYENVTTVVKASESLRESTSLKELLNIILLMGNYMNGSSLQGGAVGIRIASLNKLIDTKASVKTSLTLLHVLAGTVRQEFPSILAFVDDLKDTGRAARIMASFNDIVHEYTDMRQKLNQLNDELKTHWKPENVEQGDQFSHVMSEYYNSAVSQFENLETLYLNMDVKWKDTMLFYGENPKDMRPDDFFSIFSTFLGHWKVASIEEQQYSDRMERKLWQKRHQCIPSKKYTTMNSCNSSSNDNSNSDFTGSETPDGNQRRMDDLVNRLRTGKSLHESRRLRHRNHQNSNHALQLSASLSAPVSSSITHSSSSAHLDCSNSDDGCSLSAEDLLRDLQNGD